MSLEPAPPERAPFGPGGHATCPCQTCRRARERGARNLAFGLGLVAAAYHGKCAGLVVGIERALEDPETARQILALLDRAAGNTEEP